MKKYFKNLFNRSNRGKTLVFLILSILFLSVGVAIGITDNFPGILLVYASSSCLILAFTHIFHNESFYLKVALYSIGLMVLFYIFLLSTGSLFYNDGVTEKLYHMVEVFIIISSYFLLIPAALIGFIKFIYYAVRNYENEVKKQN